VGVWCGKTHYTGVAERLTPHTLRRVVHFLALEAARSQSVRTLRQSPRS
jgi:hypothetical protein